MGLEKINTLIIGGGQAGLAMSEHLGNNQVDHLIIEKERIVESWRTSRWDRLVANGPAWHDRFPTLEFSDLLPDEFATKDRVVAYFEEFAKKINAPIRCNVNVNEVLKVPNREKFKVTTSEGIIEAKNVVAATGAFQKPVIPPLLPKNSEFLQIHSKNYYNPGQLPKGAVLIVGAGSSGSQIAEELSRAGRKVFLSVGPHDRPPRRYRGKDNVWWFGVLGVWQEKTPDPKTQHVTIAVSGLNGGHTINFRKYVKKGITLLGLTKKFENGILYFANDLKKNIEEGDKNYLSILDRADEYIKKNNLEFPEEPEARIIEKNPECVNKPILKLDLEKYNIKSIIWATGYTQNFSWLKVDTFDDTGKPLHVNGVSKVSGVYFIGLPWLSMRGSSFIWGIWQDSKYLAEHIAQKEKTNHIDENIKTQYKYKFKGD